MPPPRTLDFPDGFLWGLGTSAYQIEGSLTADGRGPSIWEDFKGRPGAVYDGNRFEPACDSYRRWSEDVRLLSQAGVAAYRFSLAWPRLLPAGTGRSTRPAWPSTSGPSTPCSKRASNPCPPCTTGTCRRRCRSGEAGAPVTWSTGSASTPGSSPTASATASGASGCSTSPTTTPGSATASAPTPPA